jgi:hypothetical protein
MAKSPCPRANFSLRGTTRNITPQIFLTHPTLEQHKIHFKKNFTSNFMSKDCLGHVKLQFSIKFFLK